ncbi:hypothetical protein PTTG_26447 [Puccinia triticina 1-1 BBBD Race 1]|uniref:Uncharacterized protein n=1 Tax=Puccinia triticina (isolate 1-1 / race 1 (BBBD)) TaxID=630390 RepID=A0A180GUR3_PUCT1|nr:hypothetical protein PTTG_26447 [Puccinia triticina 1-1 BBBD Race 1]
MSRRNAPSQNSQRQQHPPGTRAPALNRTPRNVTQSTNPPNTNNRFNPLRGVTRATPEGGGGAHIQTRLENANFFDQEANDQGDRSSEHGSRDSDEELGDPLRDDEGLYDVVWPVLRQTGPIARSTESLEALMVLDEDHLQLVNRIMLTPPDGQWRVSVIMMASIMQRLAITAAPPIVAPVLPRPVSEYAFTQVFRDFIRIKIREILTIGNVHAYTRTQTVAGIPLVQTPLMMLNNYLHLQSDEFKNEHLPPDWPQNHESSRSVLGLLRVLMKHERGALRTHVLTNVKEFNRHPIDGVVPSLMDLVLLIDRAMGPKGQLRTIEAVNQSYTPTRKIRIAYIRLEVVHRQLNPNPNSNLTQWEVIDCRLEHLRRQSDQYRNAFARIIVRKDRELFGNRNISQINKDEVTLPSEEEIADQIFLSSQADPGQAPVEDEELDENHLFE